MAAAKTSSGPEFPFSENLCSRAMRVQLGVGSGSGGLNCLLILGRPSSTMPAQAGIHSFQPLLDSHLRGNDSKSIFSTGC